MMRTFHRVDATWWALKPNLKRVLYFATSVLLLVGTGFDFGLHASAQQYSSSSIVGRWRALETSKGGLGAVYEFRSDGTVDFGFGAVVEMPWRVENNQLVVPPATVGGEEQKSTLQWFGDSKLRLKTEASVTEFTRVGDRPDAGNPLIGEWIEHREMAGHNIEAHWLFYPNNKVLLVMPIKIEHGSYTTSGSVLHLTMPGLRPECRFEMKDKVLTLSEPDGSNEDRYARY